MASDVNSQSTSEVVTIARNLSIGDKVRVNQRYLFHVREKAFLQEPAADRVLELAGQVFDTNDDNDGQWRVLVVPMDSILSPVMGIPGKSVKQTVVHITPASQTIVSGETASTLLSDGVFPGQLDGDYVDTEWSGALTFSDEVTIIGECECEGDVGELGKKAVCEDCGHWVPIEVWNAWQDENDAERPDDTDDDTVSGNCSLDDFT